MPFDSCKFDVYYDHTDPDYTGTGRFDYDIYRAPIEIVRIIINYAKELNAAARGIIEENASGRAIAESNISGRSITEANTHGRTITESNSKQYSITISTDAAD